MSNAKTDLVNKYCLNDEVDTMQPRKKGFLSNSELILRLVGCNVTGILVILAVVGLIPFVSHLGGEQGSNYYSQYLEYGPSLVILIGLGIVSFNVLYLMFQSQERLFSQFHELQQRYQIQNQMNHNELMKLFLDVLSKVIDHGEQEIE